MSADPLADLLLSRNPALMDQARALIAALDWEQLGVQTRLLLIAELLVQVAGPPQPELPRFEGNDAAEWDEYCEILEIESRQFHEARDARVQQAVAMLPSLPASDVPALRALPARWDNVDKRAMVSLSCRGPGRRGQRLEVSIDCYPLLGEEWGDPIGVRLQLRGRGGHPLRIRLGALLEIPF